MVHIMKALEDWLYSALENTHYWTAPGEYENSSSKKMGHRQMNLWEQNCDFLKKRLQFWFNFSIYEDRLTN
jgi:hypothetical protein